MSESTFSDAALRRLLSVLVIGAFMTVLDVTVVNVAIGRLSEDLDSGIVTIQWVVTAYMLALAAAVPLTSWLSRRFGTTRLYIVTLVGFTVASMLCGLAWSAGALIAFRIVQGAAGGMVLPVAQTIAAQAAGPARMRKTMATIGTVTVIAPIVGPVIGGGVLEVLSWRWVFLINVPIGVAGVVFAARVLRHDRGGREAGPIDLTGLLLLGAGLPLITFGVTKIGEGAATWSLGSAPALLAGVIAVVAFVLHALRVPNPLLEMRLYANRTFAAGALLTAMLGAAVFGPYLLLPLFYQDARAATPLEAGLLFAPQGIGAWAGIYLVGRLGTHISGGRLAVIGATIMTIFTIPFALMEADTPLLLLSLALTLRGFGIGLAMMSSLSSALTVLDRDQINDATPQINILMRVGGSVATAAFAVILAGQAVGGVTAYRHTFVWVVALCAACIPVAGWLLATQRAVLAPQVT